MRYPLLIRLHGVHGLSGDDLMMPDEPPMRCAGPGCHKKIDYEHSWAFTDGLPCCSQHCYMRYIKAKRPVEYERLSIVLGAVD
jgi:hypothetical protein